MVGLSIDKWISLPFYAERFDFFNHLCLDPYHHTLTYESLIYNFERVSTKLRPDRLGVITPPPGIDYAILSSFIEALRCYTSYQNQQGVVKDINERGKDDWISTWDLDNIPGNWVPIPTFTETKKRVAKGKYPP